MLLVLMFNLGDGETQNSITEILEFIKVVKYIVKMMPESVLYIIMVFSACGIAYKNITRGAFKWLP